MVRVRSSLMLVVAAAAGKEDDDDCLICCEPAPMTILRCCRAHVHDECLAQWAKEAPVCPHCQRRVHSGQDRRGWDAGQDVAGYANTADAYSRVLDYFTLWRQRYDDLQFATGSFVIALNRLLLYISVNEEDSRIIDVIPGDVAWVRAVKGGESSAADLLDRFLEHYLVAAEFGASVDGFFDATHPCTVRVRNLAFVFDYSSPPHVTLTEIRLSDDW